MLFGGLVDASGEKNQLLGILRAGEIPVLGDDGVTGQVSPPAPGLILSPSSIRSPRVPEPLAGSAMPWDRRSPPRWWDPPPHGGDRADVIVGATVLFLLSGALSTLLFRD